MKTAISNVAPGQVVKFHGEPCIVLEHRTAGTLLVTAALVLGALAVWFTSPMIVGMLWALLMIPLSSVGIRRLHDLNLPGGIWTVWLTITVILPMFGLSNYMNNEGHLSDYMLYLHYGWLFVTGTLLLFLCFASGQEGVAAHSCALPFYDRHLYGVLSGRPYHSNGRAPGYQLARYSDRLLLLCRRPSFGTHFEVSRRQGSALIFQRRTVHGYSSDTD